MNTLKKGKTIVNSQKIRCWKCKSQLEVFATDLLIPCDEVTDENEEREDVKYSNNTKYTCICQECGRENVIKKLNENLTFELGITR